MSITWSIKVHRDDGSGGLVTQNVQLNVYDTANNLLMTMNNSGTGIFSVGQGA